MGSERFVTDNVRPLEGRVMYVLRSPERRHRFGVNAVRVVADPTLSGSAHVVYTAGRDAAIRGWAVDRETEQTKCIKSLDGHVDWVNDLLLLPSRKSAVSCSSDTTVKIWNLEQSRCVETLIEHTDYVKAISLVHTCEEGLMQTPMVASGGLDGRLIVWDVQAGRLLLECGYPGRKSTIQSSIYCLKGVGGSVLVSGSTDRLVSLWDVRSGEKVVKLRGHSDAVKCLAMNSEETMLLSGGADCTVLLWDLRQQRSIKSYESHEDSVWSISASKSFDYFISGGREGAVWCTDIGSGSSMLAVVNDFTAKRDNMILSTALAPDESGIWVSTVGSTVHYWDIGEKWKESRKKLSHSSSLSEVPLEEEPMPLHTTPVVLTPSATIMGLPGITGYKVMNNRRHLLTIDSRGIIEKWDITSGRMLETFDGDRSLEEVASSIEEEVVVPSWFTIDIRLGSICVKLEKATCFNADIYAVDAGLTRNDEVKVNLGCHLLKALFAKFIEKTGVKKGASSSQDDAAPFLFERDLPVFISDESSPLPRLRRLIPEFDGSEEPLLPTWVADLVLRDSRPVRDPVKVSFVLQPYPDSDIAALSPSKVTAPRTLRAKKVIDYIVKELAAMTEPSGKSLVTLTERDIELVCNERIVPLGMSLAAIRHFIWKSPEDLEVAYRLRSD